jgi:hypothetical protein
MFIIFADLTPDHAMLLSHVGKYYPFTMQALGWLGTFAYLLGYLLISLQKISAGKLYHILNIAGALGLICNALYLTDYPNIVVNFAWMAIAVFAIYRNTRRWP